ncbi:hypothetical protein [Candidatus Igneacidithiobacillus taiwanensis]|nr:hypothetical protein [Candidatus Igneacidithiobacillus taiwanensis]
MRNLLSLRAQELRLPAALMAGTLRGAGISGKKKGPEIIRALGIGGGGGN